MAKRINRAIELLSQGQPLYYTGGHTGSPWTADTRPSGTLTAHDSPVLTHEQGTIDAATWADYIEEILAVPGIGYAEMGPGDMSLSLGYRSLPNPWPDEMVELDRRVQAACREHGVAFHWTHVIDDLPAMIDGGGQVSTCPSADFAAAGRAYTKRTMPV